MRFSWKGLLLAPLLVPALLGGTFVGPSVLNAPHALDMVQPFLIVLVPGCVASYGATVFLLLPSLYVVSRWRTLSWAGVCLLGAALGFLLLIPVIALEWKGSGTHPGPPTEPFLDFLWRWGADPLTLAFPMAGLVTAALYWWLAAPRRTGPHGVARNRDKL